MNYSIDWDGPGEWDEEDCDCLDEEMTEALEADARAQEAWAGEMDRTETPGETG